MSAKCASIAKTARWVLAAGCLLSAALTARGANERFAELKVKGKTYTNAVVTGRTEKDLFIRHSGGFVTVKFSELDRATLQELGITTPPSPSSSKAGSSKAADTKTADAKTADAKSGNADPEDEESSAQETKIKLPESLAFLGSWQVELGLTIGVMLGYILFSRSCYLLCRRAGAPSDLLVWFPLLKRLALFKAVGVSWWWFFLGFIIPFVGACAWILCCIRLCETFHCTRWWTLIMIWPLIGWPVFMYLAWTSRADDAEPAVRYRMAA